MSPQFIGNRKLFLVNPYDAIPHCLFNFADSTDQLPESVRFSDIKAAYRHLSMQCHPDRNPHDISAAVRFQQIARAYEILKTYCLSCDPQLDEDTEYSFVPNVVDNVFMMTDIGRVF